MVTMEKNISLALMKGEKQNLIETKYSEEPVTCGQVLAAYHFPQSDAIQAAFPDQNKVAPASAEQSNTGIAKGQCETSSPAKQAIAQFAEEQ